MNYSLEITDYRFSEAVLMHNIEFCAWTIVHTWLLNSESVILTTPEFYPLCSNQRIEFDTATYRSAVIANALLFSYLELFY
jgi:hypothetical protein